MNCHGYCMMIDPVLEGFDLPLLIDMPIKPEQVPKLDSVLLTHSDNDHFSLDTLRKLAPVTHSVHAPKYVAELFQEKTGNNAFDHDIDETINHNKVKITLTPANHLWQNETTKFDREFNLEDFCGFWLDTLDGSFWVPGDSKLLQSHLEMPEPDAILFDFSDNEWHIGFDNAVLLANTYKNADLILSHWGTVDAPNMNVFNGDPKNLYGKVINPDRIRVLAAGEPYILKKRG